MEVVFCCGGDCVLQVLPASSDLINNMDMNMICAGKK